MARGQHAQQSSHGGARLWVIAVAVVALAVAAAGFALIPRPHSPAAATTSTPPPVLSVLSTAPTGANVDSGSVISVQFSTDLAPGSPLPTLSPPVAGQWAVLSPSLLQYEATAPLLPGTQETITVPDGAHGVVGSRGQHLDAPFTASFTVAPGSTLRLQQMLAELGYLPLNFTAASPLTSPTQEGDPQVGTFTWRWANQPASLTSLWTPGTYNVITKGAVMNFESQHNLTVDGIAGPAVWGDVLTAVENGQGDALPYGYVYVSQNLPESATVYQNGVEVYQSVANTGVAGAPTGVGTFPVYARYTVTTMSGTNPDGSKYVDPGIRWVSYFNGGDALHGFPRASYGFPQSDGCVEMPIANAAVIFPLTPLGTLVTVN
ncbi:MAG: L,D-transpeptidase family protein [Acidimicrobiales bacterium]|jgi:lipoprotein-anchoring transpeptidase ErfK/SrfK